MAKKQSNRQVTAGSALMTDMTASASASSKELDQAFRIAFPKRPAPKSYFERNEALHRHYGYVPGRDRANG